MDDMKRDDEAISKLADYYHKKGTFVHIKKWDGHFYNATIQTIGAEFIEIHDRVLGLIPVFFSQIKNIEPFTKPREVESQ